MKWMLRLSPDLTIKADRTRRRFLRVLMENLRDALKSEGLVFDLEPGWVRILVECDDPRAGEIVRRVFGVHSVSRVEERPWLELDKLVDEAEPLFRPLVTGKTFAVRARRSGAAPYRSREVEVALGARLAPYGTVRLVRPEVTCSVELRDERAFFLTEWVPAWRGLPVGCEGRAVSLISGGFDSAVASWMMLRRGAALDYVFCRLGGPTHTLGTLRVLQVLGECWSYGQKPRVHILPFEDVVDVIRRSARPPFWQLLLKRFMYRAAELVASRVRGHAIITGESMGQVSSQTLKNLHALHGGLQLPILRPLVGMDKEEIIARSREIGTHDVSATVQEYCDIVPDKPATGAPRRWVAEEEARVEVDLAGIVRDRKVLEIRRLGPEDLSIQGLEVDEIPEGATILDLRRLEAYRTWHYPEALHMNLSEALGLLPRFERHKTYVVYCEIGLKSAHLADRMREAGLTAYNFRDGMKRLVPYAASRDLLPLGLLPTGPPQTTP